MVHCCSVFVVIAMKEFIPKFLHAHVNLLFLELHSCLDAVVAKLLKNRDFNDPMTIAPLNHVVCAHAPFVLT
jgi:hypothetical protein